MRKFSVNLGTENETWRGMTGRNGHPKCCSVSVGLRRQLTDTGRPGSVAVVVKHEDGVMPGVENRGWWIDSIVSTSVLVLGSD